MHYGIAGLCGREAGQDGTRGDPIHSARTHARHPLLGHKYLRRTDRRLQYLQSFLLGSSSRTGAHFLYEPLYFYSAYDEDDQLIPWIATGHEYNQDFTQVTVHIRPGVTWSDGTPWTAADLAYTVAALKENAPELFLSTDMETWVERVEVEDELTARFVLKQPNPRFVFNYLTNCFFNGIVVVPKHIWEGRRPQDL